RYRVNDMIEGARNFSAPANTAATSHAPPRVERRSAHRPWADRSKVQAGRKAARANGTVGVINPAPQESKNDSEWREF
ncbi:MAG: hypothetical protein JO042_09200, partial [Sinobacteraceae bacterium]|nr:hypothetical protein [Nevskiaceae bacterium]